MKEHFIIALDGHSSTGKSSLAKKIAKTFSILHIDSGALYRGVALYLYKMGQIQLLGEEKLKDVLPKIKLEFVRNGNQSLLYLNDEVAEKEIRSLQISQLVSNVAKDENIRDYLLDIQREFAKGNSVIMDGRDIGTVVFPQADLKIFLTASAEIRAERRHKEMLETGEEVSFQEVLDNVNQRDYADTHREISPLKKADDAIELDNSLLSEEQTFQEVVKLLQQKGLI
ncbi:MAG: (d)CMP kinase [Flavobacteriaceae bacterium]|nr:MAG: (d)CMP kinase [Flavobacteriaceae bacterium]